MPRGQIGALTLLVTALIVSAGSALLYYTRGQESQSGSIEPTIAEPDRWNDRWDPTVGLWWQDHPGHTEPVMEMPRVHSAPGATSRLLLSAQAGKLRQVDVSAVLKAIRAMQVTDDGRDHGCFRWYWEEDQLYDKNASFFAGMSLIALQRCYADQMSQSQRDQLEQILRDLQRFFAESIAQREFFYPNRSLGEIVGAYLIAEMYGINEGRDELIEGMHAGADYFKEYNWGWGEHMSDIYGGICLDELSALLLFSRELPKDLRAKYEELFHELLAIDDAFGARPRVPAIRSYAFTQSPRRLSYREWIKPLESNVAVEAPATPVMPPEVGGVFQQRPPLGATFAAMGWHELAPKRTPARRDVSFPGFEDSLARAYLAEDMVIGSLSRFPLVPTAEYFEWGMSWQCFPVAFYRDAGDWAFLQWEAREGERVRAHPANDWLTSYHDNALSTSFSPPPVGETYTLQRGGNVLVLRVFKVVPSSCDSIKDRLRIVDSSVKGQVIEQEAYWRQLVLKYPERTIAVQCVPFTGNGKIHIRRYENAQRTRVVDWSLGFDGEALEEARTLVTLWGISVDGTVESGPMIEERLSEDGGPRADEEKVVALNWEWPGVEWNVEIDPLSDAPLREIAE